jgi:FtsP/CotA-like multicopper oxidase with cupredoxin domain
MAPWRALFALCGSAVATLPQPAELRSANGELNVTLEINVSRLTDGPFAWNRRSYNGQPTGPTLRVKPGDTLRVLLVNRLTAKEPTRIGKWQEGLGQRPRNGDWLHDYDVYGHPNYTNLHVHGMAVSPEGCHDNILRQCAPETNMTYEYEIPADHPGGTFWYHPHMHGSGALQVASGMVGAIIVEDVNPSSLPGLSEMEEQVFVIHEVAHSNMPFGLQNIICYFCIDNFAWPSGDQLKMQKKLDAKKYPDFAHCGAKFLPNTTRDLAQRTQPLDCEYLVINGAYQPEVSVTQGVYQRWRWVQSSTNSAVRFMIDAACETLVIARDGRYLSKPLNVTGRPIMVTAGSRADFAVRCNKAGVFSVTSLSGGIHKAHGPSSITGMIGTTEFYEPVSYPGQVLATIRAEPGQVAPTPAAWTLPSNAFRGKALLDQPVARKFQVVYNMTAYGVEGKIPKPIGQFLNGGQYSINGKSFTNKTEHCMVKGEVEEWTIINAANINDRWMHSFHIHQNWFQIVKQDLGEEGQLVLEDMQPGDWRDTVQVPINGSVTLRLQIDFTGVLPFHCHVAAHQDIGMMQLIQVVEHESECPEGTMSPREAVSEGAVLV